MRARPVSEAQQPAMYRIVRELATTARQPMPRLYVSPVAAAERLRHRPQPAARRGLLHRGHPADPRRRELRAVLGHELSHVYNRDILISSVAGALAAAITYLAQFALFFGGGDRRPRPQPVRRAADG